jgi:L-fuconolactonase
MDALFDSHAHFYTSDIHTYPVDATGAREGEEALLKRMLADPGTPERIFELWDASNVIAGAAVQYNTAYKTDNRYLFKIRGDHPERIKAVAILNANDSSTPDNLRRMVERAGVTGLRLVGYSVADGSFDFLTSASALETWAEAERLGIALVLMIRLRAEESPQPALTRIGELASKYSKLPIVLDHCCWPEVSPSSDAVGFTPAHHALVHNSNVFLKVTSLNFGRLRREGVDAGRFIRAAADLFGAGRLMWGSDFGNTLTEYSLLTKDARQSGELLNDGERRAYFHDTAARLFAERNRVAF